ncbi:APC family permease [Streptomyces phaeolivaceus]|uniref:APC family permease n=1 Tax=Streptomyces phaeolivaceus TaxID=2653200 RepID=A0A5P8KD95_9ACTN|nr:APC family permease [Streptomyces phaeolivaceus]QFR00783.1 APC family permease [Streptomyces phaeolivaceus]
MATSDEWSRVGFTGNPVSGNPGVLDMVTKELRDLSDLSGRVSNGLDTLLTKAEDGGFEGRTADALRTYVKDELKTFMANINRSFDMAADATARYARALGDSQDRAENAADTVAALERVGGTPLAENDPEMTRARNEVDAEIDTVQAEAKILEDTLREAARLVSRPVKKPKQSFWKRFVSTFFKVLEIVALVITLVAAVIGGPLGLVAFGLGTVLFAKALVDYAMGNGNALSLGLAFLGILFPSTKGLTTLGGLARMASAGGKALGGALSASGRLLFRGGGMLFSSPGRLLSLAGQGLVRFGGGLGTRAVGGFMALPRVLSKTPAMLGSALRFMGGFARGTFRQGWSALTRDFVESTAFIGGGTAGRLGVFTFMSLGRLTMTALLPMRYSEIARFGYRGAARMGFIDRGLHFTPRALRPLGRTGSLAADLTNQTGRNLDRGGTLRPVTGTDTGQLAVPGTPEFTTTLDELAEISVTPVATPRTPAFSSLTGTGSPRMPSGLDELGGRLDTLDTLATVGLPVGTVPGGQRLGVLDPLTGRVADDLTPPRPRTTLGLFDQVNEFGAPLTPGSPTTLLPPRTAVDQLRELDELIGMERTSTGLLKPLDELTDLAEVSLDGRLGGLTEFQVGRILDGEIDLVKVTPDGVVLRVGTTDPVDVRVRLKDGVRVDVLGPSDPRVPTWSAATGADGLDDLGIRLDDLARLIPDTTDGSRGARDLLGLGPVRTDLTTPVGKGTTFTPLTLRDIVTGGATGRLATERFQAWLRTQTTQVRLDTAGRGLGELDALTDVPPLSRAKAELDLSAARIDFDRSRLAFDRLGMNLDTVRRDITVMMTRIDGPGAALPTGELRLLDDLGRPTGRWITMEPGPTVTWVLRSDTGIVPDVRVRMVDGAFTVTTPEGVVTRFGADGRPAVLGDPGSVTLPRLPGTGLDEVVLPPPAQLDRLAFAADRSVDIQTITPAPVWRTTEETLWRIEGKRPLDQIFSEGFTVRDPLETSLDVMVRTGQPSAFLSTTTDRNLVWDGILKFEIEASGGIDVGRTFERSMGTDAWRASGWASENEIAFPGGLASEFIRGAYRLDAQANPLEWIPNPNFGGNNPFPELALAPRGAGEGTSGISALDFQGLSLDDQLRLLDQLDLGGTRPLDDLGSLDGAGSLDGIGSQLDEIGSQLDDLGYLSDDFTFDRFDAPAPRTDTVLVDPADFAGTTGLRTEWQRAPLENSGFTFTDGAGDIRLVFGADDVRQFTDIRLPGGDGFVRFDAGAGPGSLPRVVGPDGVPLPGGATIEPVRGALGVVTGVRVQSLDGAWIGRFDLDGTRLSEQLTLSGPVGGPLTGSRLTTTFTSLPGGDRSATFRLTVPGLGEGAFDVVRLDGELAQRLPGGFSITDTATGGRFVFDRGGRFVDLPTDGAPPIRLDVSGSTTPNSTTDLPSTLNDLGDLGGAGGLGDLARLGDTGSLGELGDLGRLGDLGEAGDLSRLSDVGDLGRLGDAGDLGRLDELGDVGALNRPTLPDLPRTDPTSQPTTFDARFTSTVGDGAPTPLNPARFDGVALSGADELANLRLRVTEFPATDLAPASFRIDVLDFGAPGGPVRLENVNVTLREGGGLNVTGPQGGVRWQIDALGRLEYRELPLTGTDLALRLTDDALNPMPRVVGPDGVPVQGATLTPVRAADGTLGELTVRVPVADTGGLTAVWRFEPGGTLRGQELPLTLPGLDGPAGLGVKVTITPGAGATTTRVLELTGPANLTGSFRLGPMDGSLAGRLPNGFTVTDTITGSRFHFDANGRLVIRDVPARDGSGFLRFTEDAAPGTPPVRLDDLGGPADFGGDLGDVARVFERTLDEAGGPRGPLDDLNRFPSPDAPHTTPLRGLDHPTPEEGSLVDGLWNDLTQDIRPLSTDELNRLLNPDSPRTDALSEIGDVADAELDSALQARLDALRQANDGLRGADDPIRVPLSGVDDLADFDLRVTRLPATDEAPRGSIRLDLADRVPGGTGPVRASDFTVELLDDSGRFAVIDPAGTTRFTFAPDGAFLGRQTALAHDGLPQGMRLDVTITPLGDGTRRVAVDVIGPPGTTGSIRFTGVDNTLSGRLPGGFTLTDTLTGSRFHFDHTGRLAFRDLPDPEGSGFLRFTEGAGSDTPPVRLDELGGLGDLGNLGGDLRERFPLHSVPEHEVLDEALDDALSNAELSDMFGRTLDEASSLRTAPEGAPADMSGIAGAMDFLHTAPDSATFQGLDLPGVQRLADDAALSLDRLGLRPGLLGDQLREMTTQARLVLRRQGASALGDYLDLPLATRLEDLQGATPAGRVLGDFTVTPTPHGGPGGSRYTVHHTPSDITLGFDANRGLTYQEVFLRGGPTDLDGLKLGVAGRSADGGPWTPTAVDFVGTRPADDLLTVAPSTHVPGGLTLTDAAGTTHWHYGPEGVHAFQDVHLPGDRGLFRFDADAPGGVPRVLDRAGGDLPGFRAELLDDGRIALIPTGKAAQPLERTVFDPAGRLLEETVAVRVKGGRANGQFWRIDHATGKAVRLDSSGTPLTGRFDTATLEKSATGQVKLIGEGKVTLFEREVLGNGNVLHLDLDRSGRARWTEFDEAGNRLRAGERIFDGDRRTFHDTLPYRWAPMDVLDVRTYTKTLDGGLIRAEKNAEGDWVWTRFDKNGTEVLHGTRDWSWTRIGYKDTYLDPATGQRAVAQRRGDVWPLDGYHGSRQYLEHPVLSGPAPGGMRANPLVHTAVGPNNKPIDFIDELTEEVTQLADGGTLHVARISDQRLPAAAWYPRAGHGRFDGFFRNFFTGDSMFQVSKWTETAADGTELKGVRLAAHGGRGWQDIDQFGRIVRETRTLENGNVIEVGRSATDPRQWGTAPKWNGSADAYELPWLDTRSGTTGTRHVSADGGFVDVFEDADGNELLSLRSQGTGVREYLGENPARGIGADDVSGVWVDKNTQLQITGRRDHWGDLYVEAHGNPRKDHWTWKATGPDGEVTEGVRIQNRGSLVRTRTWDDSFVDFERLPNGRRGDAIRERNATGDGSVWVDATRGSDGVWTWQKTGADGTVTSKGVRTYQDLAGGRWSDHIGTDVVRFRDGGRVREYAYTVNERVVPPPVDPGRITLSDLLSRSARHFEPDVSATVNREVWQEFDMGKVLHRRDPVEGVEGRFRESESLWGQWREYQDGRMVAQRTITGRVWVTDAFGRWANFDIAKLPEISSLPRVGGEVGLDGHRSWRLIGREADFRGYTAELRGFNREFRDVFHEIWTGVEDGSSAAMPMWRHQIRKAVTDFTMGYLIEFGTSLAVSAITADLGNTKFDPTVALQRAALNGAIGGGIRVSVNVAYDTTRLGYVKYGLTNLDQGQDWHRHPLASSDDWDGEWTVFENPTRWRSGSYDFFNGLGVGVLTGFVNNAVNAAVFGVNGQKRTGLDALEAGAWGAAGSAFSGITSGLLRYTWHATAGSRIFHRGGPGELIWQAAEALGAGTLSYGLNNKDTANIQPSRAFPPTTTAPTAPAPTAPTSPQPLTLDPAALPDGTELL